MPIPMLCVKEPMLLMMQAIPMIIIHDLFFNDVKRIITTGLQYGH
jgi:hypothetical protein